MSEPITMPTLSDTMNSGRLVKWSKKLGDPVKKGETLAEIETDKAIMEVEAFHDGFLAGPLAAEGTEMPVGQIIGYIADKPGAAVETVAHKGPTPTKPVVPDNSANASVPTEPKDRPKANAASVGKSASTSTTPPAAVQVKASVASQPPLQTSPQKVKTDGTVAKAALAQKLESPEPGESAPNRSPASQPASATSKRDVSTAQAPEAENVRVSSSPLARRLADEKGIDLSQIEGSGPNGRIVASDVESTLPAPTSTPTAGRTTPGMLGMSDQQIRALYAEGSYEIVPHDGMRKIIAQRLVQSNLTIPHFYLTIGCDIGRLLSERAALNGAAKLDKSGKPLWKLSVNDFIIKALALALQRVPDANATWTEGGMLKHHPSDIGVAVAIKGGLIAPLVRDAETKSLSVISNEVKELALRARARKLKPEEYRGGTTAVSNLGMHGIEEFTAVINPPQSTILAVGVGEERCVARSGRMEIATIMTVTLSCDHRVVDGALGAELLGAFKELIEHPVTMVG